MPSDFSDLLAANRQYADAFDTPNLEAPARARLAIVTCMDSRIDPLGMFGLGLGDAKVVRNPGGRVTEPAVKALILATHLLNVDRVAVVQHTRCAVASNSLEQLRDKVAQSAGQDVSWQSFPVIADQHAALAEDCRRVGSHPLIPDHVAVAGFVYDVDTGLLDQVV